MDLEIWESTASLPLQESTDSKSNAISLVADYGSLLTKIGATCITMIYISLNLIDFLSFADIWTFITLKLHISFDYMW